MNQKKEIIEQLKSIYHKKSGKYLDCEDLLKSVSINKDIVTLTFHEAPGSYEIKDLENKIEEFIFSISWVKELEINLAIKNKLNNSHEEGLSNVTNIIAVSSCKGGVGKSTMALNIASGLSLNGAQVGIFDADIYGPSLPALIKPQQIAATSDEESLPPFINQNIKLMSYGYIQEQANQPAILRGPIASNLLKQMLFKTDWGHLDYLIIDCPPGTGDIILSLTQEIQLDGAIIVTTPHELSYIDVEKGIEMFNKVKVPILGMVENMSYFQCGSCDEKHSIFGSGRLQRTSSKYHIKNWYEIPINQEISSYQDKNIPFLFQSKNNNIIDIFKKIGNDIAWQLIESETKIELELTFDNSKSIVIIKHNSEKKEIPFSTLRLACKCALCVDEYTGEQKFKEEHLDKNIQIKSSYLVGHYGQGIEWIEHGTTHTSMYQNKFLIGI